MDEERKRIYYLKNGQRATTADIKTWLDAQFGAAPLTRNASSLPAYLQMAERLRQAISAGTFPIGYVIPSTARLAAIYRVSTAVSRQAVDQLQREGLVEGRAGVGNIVIALPDDTKPGEHELARLTTLLGELSAAALDQAHGLVDEELARRNGTDG